MDAPLAAEVIHRFWVQLVNRAQLADSGPMTDELPDRLRGLLRVQRGIISRPQALAVGLTEKAVVVKLRSGRWQRIHTGVYAAFSGEPPRAAMLWAAVLRAGPAAVLSHHTAAELHGLSDVVSPLIHVTVPSGSRVRRPDGVVVHYSGRLKQSRHPALSPPRTRLEDSVLDMAAEASNLDDAVSVLLRAIGRHRTTAGRISMAMQQRPKMRWRADLTQALAMGGEGTHSLLEYRYVTRVELPHSLPRGVRQRRAMRAGLCQYQDIAYEDYLLVVELDGQSAHPLETRWQDVRRDNANAAHGLATIRLGYADVSVRPCASAAVIGQALRCRGWNGALSRCGSACQLLVA